MRRRDLAAERQQRDSYALLQHIYNLTGGDQTVRLLDMALARDLAFDHPTVLLSIDHLAAAGYIRCDVEGGLAITRAGAEYVAGRAGNRRSVRDARPAPGASLLKRWQDILDPFAQG